jgi:hypothetical protein
MGRKPRSAEFKQIRKQNTDAFREAYNKLPRGVYLDVRNQLIRDLGWSQSLLYMRLSGAKGILEPELPVVRELFKKYGIEVFT